MPGPLLVGRYRTMAPMGLARLRGKPKPSACHSFGQRVWLEEIRLAQKALHRLDYVFRGDPQLLHHGATRSA